MLCLLVLLLWRWKIFKSTHCVILVTCWNYLVCLCYLFCLLYTSLKKYLINNSLLVILIAFVFLFQMELKMTVKEYIGMWSMFEFALNCNNSCINWTITSKYIFYTWVYIQFLSFNNIHCTNIMKASILCHFSPWNKVIELSW